MTTTKTAKIQWGGKYVHVYEEGSKSNLDLFSIRADSRNLIARIQTKAADLGYSVPQIYPGKDGIVRIWL